MVHYIFPQYKRLAPETPDFLHIIYYTQGIKAKFTIAFRNWLVKWLIVQFRLRSFWAINSCHNFLSIAVRFNPIGIMNLS